MSFSAIERNKECTQIALKHCNKAIKKFKNIKCLEGSASCYFIKIFIHQLEKYNNQSEASENEEDSDCNQYEKYSKITKLIKKIKKILPSIRHPFNNKNRSQFLTSLNISTYEETNNFIKSDKYLLNFVEGPILKYKPQNERTGIEKDSESDSPPSVATKIEKNIYSLLNSQEARLSIVLEKVTRALDKLDAVEEIISKESRYSLSRATLPKVDYSTWNLVGEDEQDESQFEDIPQESLDENDFAAKMPKFINKQKTISFSQDNSGQFNKKEKSWFQRTNIKFKQYFQNFGRAKVHDQK